MREMFKNVREKLTAKYLDSKNLKSSKKFKSRIKARIKMVLNLATSDG